MSNELIQLSGIRINAAVSSREEAVALCGQTLFDLGAVNKEYLPAMLERENIISSYMGEGFAMPHGTDASREHINFDHLVFIRFSKPIDWDGNMVDACIGIAARGDGHGEILGNLAEILIDEDKRNQIKSTEDLNKILDLLVTTEG
jgi:mannitol/fructose-specific phosphotransferase system IIA component